MATISQGQKHLVADFLANVGVAWFAAGVIGILISGTKSMNDILFSFSWGIGLGIVFLGMGTYVLKGVK